MQKVILSGLKILSEKILQYTVSVAGGLVIAMENALPFFIPCFLITAMDIVSAYFLAKRVHLKYPEQSDGKFKSEYKFKVMSTMLFVLVLIIVADYVDTQVIKDSDLAVRWVVGAFLIYQGWSILENWSSENNNKMALLLQQIMVNKMERHLNMSVSPILLNEENEEIETQTETRNEDETKPEL